MKETELYLDYAARYFTGEKCQDVKKKKTIHGKTTGKAVVHSVL